MESLVGILIAVGVLIFKLIAKSMEDSAQPPTRPVPPRPVPPSPMSQGLPKQESQSTLEPQPYFDFEFNEEPEEERVYNMSEALFEEAVPAMKANVETKKTTINSLLTETPEVSEPKEKIDPKKLIVYSEIMNRKY